jgi:hypothetical protein
MVEVDESSSTARELWNLFESTELYMYRIGSFNEANDATPLPLPLPLPLLHFLNLAGDNEKDLLLLLLLLLLARTLTPCTCLRHKYLPSL